MTGHPTTRDASAADFWAHLKKVNAGMLGTAEARHVPMSHQAEAETATLWFITAKGTDLAKAASAAPVAASYLLGGENTLYARIEGTLSATEDQATLDRLWNVVADSWFEGGSRDPDAIALRLAVKEVEFWETTGSLGFLFQIAKSRVTGQEPDMGTHGIIRF